MLVRLNNPKIYLIILISLLFGCKPQTKPKAFYYWKTRFHLSQFEKQKIKEMDINKLYLHFFDIDWNDIYKQPLPVAKIQFSEPIMAGINVTPVVYITNQTFLKTDLENISTLAQKTIQQIEIIANKNKIKYSEIQFDCDWSDQSREKYFFFLRQMHTWLAEKNITLSATIRLHQIKYPLHTGIPPVDRGMLMFYNMGKIGINESRNSIYDFETAEKYVKYVKKYILPLDVSLPIFEWGIHIREQQVVDIINNPLEIIRDTSFTRDSANWYTSKSPFITHGLYFTKNDRVKYEGIDPKTCYIAAKQLSSNISVKPGFVAFYHLDSVYLKHYEKQDLEKIISLFY
jgi:hypothetical protein